MKKWIGVVVVGAMWSTTTACVSELDAQAAGAGTADWSAEDLQYVVLAQAEADVGSEEAPAPERAEALQLQPGHQSSTAFAGCVRWAEHRDRTDEWTVATVYDRLGLPEKMEVTGRRRGGGALGGDELVDAVWQLDDDGRVQWVERFIEEEATCPSGATGVRRLGYRDTPRRVGSLVVGVDRESVTIPPACAKQSVSVQHGARWSQTLGAAGRPASMTVFDDDGTAVEEVRYRWSCGR